MIDGGEPDVAGEMAPGGGTRAGPPVLRPPSFVGRGPELAALSQALAAPPAVVLIEGEAGIGKTRLLTEFLMASERTRVGQRALVATCPPYREPLTLAPVVDAVRQAADEVSGLRLSGLAGALRPLFPEWTADLPPAPEPAGDATAARHRVFRALRELLGRLRVSVLAVEDLHWADDATTEFLLFLASAKQSPIDLVVTYRPEEVPAGSSLPRLSRPSSAGTVRRLTLGPLDVTETAGLVSSMLAGEVVSEQFAGFLHERTEGVPLAVEESVRAMRVHADLIRRDGAWVRRPLAEIVVPASIRDAVLDRVGRLGTQARAVLRAAAVLTDPAPERTLLAVCGLSAVAVRRGLTEVVQSGLLTDDGRGLVSFRHTLAGQAVYEAIPVPERRALHARAGRVLESVSPRPVARLARHFREAGDTTRWCRYAEEAADLAHATGDHGTAAYLLHDLVANAGLPTGSVIRLTNKIVLLSFTGDSQLRDLARILGSVLDSAELRPPEVAAVRFQLGRVLLVLEEIDAGRAELEKAAGGLAPGSLEAVRAAMLLGWPQGTTSPASAHLRWLRRAEEAGRSLQPQEQLRLTVDRVSALLLLGEETGWAEAAAIPEDIAAGQEQLQLTRGDANIGEIAMMWGRYGVARRRLEAALGRADRHGYLRLRVAAEVSRSYLDWLTGTWHGLADRVRTLARPDESLPTTRSRAELVGGLLSAAKGDHAHAMACLRHVVAETNRRGAVEYSTEPAGALAGLLLASGAVDEALRVTGEPMRVVVTKGTWLWATDLAPVRVEALLAADRRAEATDLVAAYAQGLRGRAAPAPEAGLALCRAILAEAAGEPTAAALFERAAAAWQALPRPYAALLARERQAQCLSAAGHRDAASALLSDVHRGLSGLGADGAADRVARRLREYGVDVRGDWRRGRRGYGSRLSPREVEVVELLVTGRTNREIATDLGRSVKTVAGQLNSAMRKLGVSTRTALAVRAIETGVVVGAQPAEQVRAVDRGID